VTLRVAQPAAGRRVAGHCRRPTARNADRPRCSRWTPLRGRTVRSLPAGRNTLRYRGRLAGRTLPPGRYRLLARARDAADHLSRQRWTTFVILE